MSGLIQYLDEKRAALSLRKTRVDQGALGPAALKATVSAEGRSGVRRIRIRDFQVISDSPADFAGYDLGPSSPELQLGVLGSCLTHTYLIQAALLNIPLESLEVEVSANIDARGSQPDHPDIPVYPHDIAYVVHIVSGADPEKLNQLKLAVERFCPILNLLQKPQSISGTIDLRHHKQSS